MLWQSDFAGASYWRRFRRLAEIGRGLAGLATCVSTMAVAILASYWLADPATWPDYPFLTPCFLAWWIFFQLAGGVWVRSWWATIAWLGALLLYPIESNLLAEQGAAFFMFGACFTALVGTIIGKRRHRRGAARAM